MSGRAIARLGVVLVFALLLAGLLLPNDVWRVQLSGDGLTLSFLQKREERGKAILVDEFERSGGLWNERSEEGARVRVAKGALQIRILEMETIDFETLALPAEENRVQVEAVARVVGQARVVYGLICAESAGPSEPDSGQAGGYVLALQPGTRMVRIGHAAGRFGHQIANAKVLVERALPASWSPGATTELQAECGRRVLLRVDGFEAAAVERSRTHPFDGAGVVVVALETAPVEVQFDRFGVYQRT